MAASGLGSLLSWTIVDALSHEATNASESRRRTVDLLSAERRRTRQECF
jgi:hypothetical protein